MKSTKKIYLTECEKNQLLFFHENFYEYFSITTITEDLCEKGIIEIRGFDSFQDPLFQLTELGKKVIWFLITEEQVKRLASVHFNLQQVKYNATEFNYISEKITEVSEYMINSASYNELEIIIL